MRQPVVLGASLYDALAVAVAAAGGVGEANLREADGSPCCIHGIALAANIPLRSGGQPPRGSERHKALLDAGLGAATNDTLVHRYNCDHARPPSTRLTWDEYVDAIPLQRGPDA